MIHIKISEQDIEIIKQIWCKWFFRKNRIDEIIDILDKDITFRKMIFLCDREYYAWKYKYALRPERSKEKKLREKICEFIFDELSDEKKVVKKYRRNIQEGTKQFILKTYENYRKSAALCEIIDKMGIEVCPYCNRNFLERYASGNKKYFKGDLDHHYSKDEMPALAISFYNLVPSCKVCNHEKGETRKRTFYPFYDYEDKEYHFSLELYEDNDEKDIIYGKAIENIEKKRFDLTVWQGISDNFNIRLRGVDETNLSEHMENSKEIFRLEQKYNHTKGYVKELIRKKYIYPQIYKDNLLNKFKDIFENEEELFETFYSYSDSEEYLLNRPLSKLTKDVLEQIKELDSE